MVSSLHTGTSKEALADALFDDWNRALQTRDPSKVADLYAPDAILLPTLSNAVRHDHAEIADYFRHFCAKLPVGRIVEANVRNYGDILINSGIYAFHFGDGSDCSARFDFVYRRDGGRWLIVEHHSSLMPE